MIDTEYIPSQPLNTAVLFLIFNRPEVTKRVFEAIRQAKPPRLYVAADGHRKGKEGEAEVVQKVRKLVMDNIDWDCEVKTLFREKNLGCKYAVGGAIDWFFKNEEMGIILEDDCLPSQSFFKFCEINLEKYKNDSRIFGISGDNFIQKQITTDSYFFTRFVYIWGWATWKKSWIAHRKLESNYNNILPTINTLSINHKQANHNIVENARKAYNGIIDTWDYQWMLSIFLSNGLIITPYINLVKNIGFGKDATHTTKKNPIKVIEIKEIKFPLIHPEIMVPNEEYDNYLYNHIYRWTDIWFKLTDFKKHPDRIANVLRKLKLLPENANKP
jgi:hypothetical protein